jgi:hypothetical protein
VAELTNTENLPAFSQLLRFFLGSVLIVGWLASTLLFWFHIFDFIIDLLTLGKRKAVRGESDGVPNSALCEEETTSLVSLVVPLFFLSLSLFFFTLSYLFIRFN